jgi:hypothetical protein
MDEKMISEIEKNILEEYKKDRRVSLNSVEKIYSDLNRSELIVATGAFILILNFLIGNKKLDNILLLHIGISFLVIMIIIKSLAYRRTADRIEKEIDIMDEKTNLRAKVLGVMNKINKGVQLSSEEQSELLEYENNCKKINSGFDRIKGDKITGMLLNEIEFYVYISGIVIILAFFILNTSK